MKKIKTVLKKIILTAVCCFSAFGSVAAISQGGTIFANTEKDLIDNIASITGQEWEQWYNIREKNWDTLTNLLCNCVFDANIDSITLEVYCEESMNVPKIEAILRQVSNYWEDHGKQFKIDIFDELEQP